MTKKQIEEAVDFIIYLELKSREDSRRDTKCLMALFQLQSMHPEFDNQYAEAQKIINWLDKEVEQ